MSHSVTITVEHVKTYVQTCDQILDKMTNIQKFEWDENSKKIINGKIEKIKAQRELILQNVGNHMETSKIISTLSKEVENLKLMTDVNFLYDNFIKDKSELITTIISEYGITAISAIDDLRNQNLKLKRENILLKINELQEQEIQDNELIKYQNIFKKEIIKTELPDNIKSDLILMSQKYKVLQDLSDINPYIAAKNEDFMNLKSFIKDIQLSLNKLNFKIISPKISYLMSDEQLIIAKINFINNENNTVEIIFSSDLKLKYKLGNYKGHACEETTEKLFNEIQNKGYIIKHKRIQRTMHDYNPQLKKTKVMEK